MSLIVPLLWQEHKAVTQTCYEFCLICLFLLDPMWSGHSVPCEVGFLEVPKNGSEPGCLPQFFLHCRNHESRAVLCGAVPARREDRLVACSKRNHSSHTSSVVFIQFCVHTGASCSLPSLGVSSKVFLCVDSC